MEIIQALLHMYCKYESSACQPDFKKSLSVSDFISEFCPVLGLYFIQRFVISICGCSGELRTTLFCVAPRYLVLKGSLYIKFQSVASDIDRETPGLADTANTHVFGLWEKTNTRRSRKLETKRPPAGSQPGSSFCAHLLLMYSATLHVTAND